MNPIPVCQIPAGKYLIGANDIIISRAEHTVQIAAFAIGQTTVTNGQFSPFIEANGYTTETWWTESGWNWQKRDKARASFYSKDPVFNQPTQPVVGLSWYETVAFAAWLAHETGLPWRLPSEVEWEAAARSPEGDSPMPRNFNTAERGLGHPWPVTEAGNVSWCGAQDMCGNVWEWCSSRWGRNWQNCDYRYPYVFDDGRENLTGTFARTMRGGSWFDPIKESAPANRGRYLPGSRGSNIGFRLAQG